MPPEIICISVVAGSCHFMSEMEILKEIEIFKELEEASLQKLGELSNIKEYKEEDYIFQENDASRELYVVLSGNVKITKTISIGVEKVLAMATPGSIVGEMALISPGGRSAAAQCVGDTKVLEMKKEDFDKFVEEHPRAGAKVLGSFAYIIADRLRITTESWKDSLLWGMKVSGATQLNFDRLIDDSVEISIELNTGKSYQGSILKVDTSLGGCELTIMDKDENLYMIPYGAITCITLPRSAITQSDVI